MRLARMGTLIGVVSFSLYVAAPAMADPPPTNPNVSVLSFDCHRGSETQAFQAVGILQSLQIAGQRLDGTGVVVFVHAEVDGQVLFDIPGQSGRADIWTCSIAEVPGLVVDVLLTPRL
jgi:hypothetical protein